MTSLQEQARALGDPTRHRIFRYLADADRPVSVAELTEQHGLNHNAIRQHLAKLVAADLVTEATAPPSGPGRPRLVYRVAPDVHSRWGVESPYERLSRMLAQAISSGRSPRDVGRDEGRSQPVEAGEPDHISRQLTEAMERAGFAPEPLDVAGRIELVLRRCPFESAAIADPAIICALHLGIAEGMTEGIDRVQAVEMIAHDPRTDDCRVRFQLER